MKATLLKMSVIMTSAIFLFVSNSWADGGNNRHHKKVDKKHFSTEHHRNDGNHGGSHYGRGWYDYPRRHYKNYYDRHRAAHRAKRHAIKHHHYRHRVIRKHYHRYKPSHNVFSYRASVFDPGWSFNIKTKSRW